MQLLELNVNLMWMLKYTCALVSVILFSLIHCMHFTGCGCARWAGEEEVQNSTVNNPHCTPAKMPRIALFVRQNLDPEVALFPGLRK
jgi:hypothetical protein